MPLLLAMLDAVAPGARRWPRPSAGRATGGTRSCSAGRRRCRGAWRSSPAPPGRVRAVRDVPPDVPLRGAVEPRAVRRAALDRPQALGCGPAGSFVVLRRRLHVRPVLHRGAADRQRQQDRRAAGERVGVGDRCSSARRCCGWRSTCWRAPRRAPSWCPPRLLARRATRLPMRRCRRAAPTGWDERPPDEATDRGRSDPRQVEPAPLARSRVSERIAGESPAEGRRLTPAGCGVVAAGRRRRRTAAARPRAGLRTARYRPSHG